MGEQFSESKNLGELSFVPYAEIQRIREKISDPFLRAEILADVFRLNTLYMIMRAGSGHIGTSFSAMDIVVWLWLEEMINPNESNAKNSDLYFSSKGHDVPGLYAILLGLGKLPYDLIHKLRRLDGLPGHPDVGTPYIITNTGALGMGVSKARGMAQARRLKGEKGRIYVLCGDGELQEGHFWESLQPTSNGKFSETTVIIDHNKIQSDTWVKDTSDLGDLEAKLRSFGWEVERCDGHDLEALKKVIARFKTIKDKPQILIADTKKGKGVSFMEEVNEDGLYKYHSGAPNKGDYEAALGELKKRINARLKDVGQADLILEVKEMPDRSAPQNPEKLIAAYGDELVKAARENDDVVVMDADLVLDTGLIPFKKEFPERYFECGIAEQDMVSFAGGLALQGKIPVVHSFECFLTTRANEQFYNNATEKTKIIYVGSLAGLLPGMPGHSHQSVRGISCLGAIPGLTLLEPSSEKEVRLAIRWAVEKNKESTYIRLTSIPYDVPFEMPEDYKLEVGRGIFIEEGKDVLIIGYGIVMVSEAVKAARELKKQGISAAVINLPWLNRLDKEWFLAAAGKFKIIVTLDSHYLIQGQGDLIASSLARSGRNPKIVSFGVEEIPACGENQEVLKYHGLDHESLAGRIRNLVLDLV